MALPCVGVVDVVRGLAGLPARSALRVSIGYGDSEPVWMSRPVLRPLSDLGVWVLPRGRRVVPLRLLAELLGLRGDLVIRPVGCLDSSVRGFVVVDGFDNECLYVNFPPVGVPSVRFALFSFWRRATMVGGLSPGARVPTLLYRRADLFDVLHGFSVDYRGLIGLGLARDVHALSVAPYACPL